MRRAVMLSLGCACAAVGAVAATPVGDGWTAHPDDQFLLEVKIRQLRLGDGVRAYETPQGVCILFGDFLAALDVPMQIDLTQGRANGWAFSESHRIDVDVGEGMVRYGDQAEQLAAGAVRTTPDGWCIDSRALSRWFGLGVKPVTSGAALILESEAKLPVELAIERERRAARLKPAKFDVATLPQVTLPYRMWRAPALDFVVSAGVTYRASDGLRTDRQASIRAAGEIARLSYDAQISTDSKGLPQSARISAYRSDPDGELLGPLRATHVGAGDVAGFDSALTGAGPSGRGGVITNRPLFRPTAFGRTRFEGDLPTGWEAELYRNGELLAFARSEPSQRYLFDDVQLHYGDNQITIISYGPHGQIRTREEIVRVGEDNVPAGKTWYWAGVNQPGRDLIEVNRRSDSPLDPDMQAAVSIEHGIDERTSVGALARAMLLDDERLTFVEGSVRRSVGPAMVEVAAAREGKGGFAARAQMLARFGSVNAGAEAAMVESFPTAGARRRSYREIRGRIDAPIRLGQTVMPAHASLGLLDNADGTREVDAAARLSANINRFNLATDLRYRRQLLPGGPSPPGELDAELIGSGRIGDVRLRGFVGTRLSPGVEFRSAELSAYWSASDTADWEGALAYDAGPKRARARVSHIRRFDSMAVALTGEAASDGSVALGVNLNFSLDSGRGFRMSREPLAGAGAVHARVYRDLNDNGRRDADEPLEPGALVTAGTRLIEKPTDSNGSVLVGGLATYTPTVIGIDSTSLSDPMLVPRKAMQLVIPRPGVPAEVEIGLVGAGDIEGVVVKSGGLGFEGLDLELAGADGQTAATARSDFDGFFLFERVPYGSYRLRLSAATARTLGAGADLGIAVTVTPDDPVARLGAIEVSPAPRIASAR